MIEVIPTVTVSIQDRYDVVSEFLHWLMDNKIPQYRGGMSGRGSFVGYFPFDQKDRISEFFSGYDPDPEFDDDF